MFTPCGRSILFWHTNTGQRIAIFCFSRSSHPSVPDKASLRHRQNEDDERGTASVQSQKTLKLLLTGVSQMPEGDKRCQCHCQGDYRLCIGCESNASVLRSTWVIERQLVTCRAGEIQMQSDQRVGIVHHIGEFGITIERNSCTHSLCSRRDMRASMR